jgi:hypothetical protein
MQAENTVPSLFRNHGVPAAASWRQAMRHEQITQQSLRIVADAGKTSTRGKTRCLRSDRLRLKPYSRRRQE